MTSDWFDCCLKEFYGELGQVYVVLYEVYDTEAFNRKEWEMNYKDPWFYGCLPNPFEDHKFLT